MSQKLAKIARAALRAEEIDYREREYEWRVRVHSNGWQQAIQRQLKPKSGRAFYKRLKKVLYGISS
jgi:hypothetical protein